MASFDAVAQNEEAYTVKSYSVKLKGSDTAKLRSQAISRATRGAFDKLLRKITPRETWDTHKYIIETVDFDLIVEKFSIVSEQTTPSYELILDISYNREMVRDLLTKENVAYTEKRAGDILIFPLLEMSNSLVLWEEENLWRDALMVQINNGHFSQYKLPDGLVGERQFLTAEMANFGAGDILRQMGINYNADTTVVLHARLDNSYLGRVIEVETQWYGKEDMMSDIMTLDYPDGSDFVDILNVAARKALVNLAEKNQGREMVQVNRPARLFLRYTPSGPSDLERLKAVVADLSITKEVILRVLNLKDSVFQVDYYGEQQQMRAQLAEAGLTVEPTNMSMVWQVHFTDDPLQGPVSYGFGGESTAPNSGM